jgi:[ribosomal protein S5]-alanine N-acetyltransferase
VFRLQRLGRAHEEAVLEFELANRIYFAHSISDRGDEFFDEFSEGFEALLAEQEAGISLFLVLVDDDENVVGRFNLYEIADGAAEVGYRVAQRVSGRGVATSGLRDLCRIADDVCGLRLLKAKTSTALVASQRVLAKAGFVAVGPTDVAGRPGVRYELDLASRGADPVTR